jgi:flagellar biosynthesis protein FlhA
MHPPDGHQAPGPRISVRIAGAPDVLAALVATGQPADLLRHHVTEQYGITAVDVRLQREGVPVGAYRIMVNGHQIASGRVVVDHVLVIGTAVAQFADRGSVIKDPIYQSPAVWVAPGVVEPGPFPEGRGIAATAPEVVLTHAMEALRPAMSAMGHGQVAPPPAG